MICVGSKGSVIEPFCRETRESIKGKFPSAPAVFEISCTRPKSRRSPSLKNPSGPEPGEHFIPAVETGGHRSEEHTSELQSHLNLVCRLLLEKQKTSILSFS